MNESACDEQVFDGIYTEHAQTIRNFVYYKCGDMDLSEDVTQEAFVKLWAKCVEVVLATVKSFLFTISQRIWLDHTRKMKVRLNFEKSELPAVDKNDPSFIFQENEFRDQIELAISELPEGQREAFLLNRIDKHTYKEIGEILGISQTAVEKRISKALAKLKDKIHELKSFGI